MTRYEDPKVQEVRAGFCSVHCAPRFRSWPLCSVPYPRLLDHRPQWQHRHSRQPRQSREEHQNELMKWNRYPVMASIAMLASCPFTAQAQSPPTGPHLRLEARSNAWDLVVDCRSSADALFLHRAPDLPTLAGNPTLMPQTNTPLTNAVRLPVLPVSGLSSRAFCAAQSPPPARTPLC